MQRSQTTNDQKLIRLLGGYIYLITLQLCSLLKSEHLTKTPYDDIIGANFYQKLKLLKRINYSSRNYTSKRSSLYQSFGFESKIKGFFSSFSHVNITHLACRKCSSFIIIDKFSKILRRSLKKHHFILHYKKGIQKMKDSS